LVLKLSHPDPGSPSKRDEPKADPFTATVRASELTPGLDWFNFRPLSLVDLRGKLVMTSEQDDVKR
jgi:hypothetical protein